VEFWVITCYFNPCHYENRLRNFIHFSRRLRQQQVNLLAVELVSSPTVRSDLRAELCDKYIRVEQADVLWAKERLLNIALKALPPACIHVCWADCDVLFENNQWARRCNELLYRHCVVQPFTQAIFLGPHETMVRCGHFRPSTSFASVYVQRRTSLMAAADMLKAHPGYAWAARRETLYALGGLYDRCILGHGDIIMALGFCHNEVRDGPMSELWGSQWEPGWSTALKADVRKWQQHAAAIVKGDVGCLTGRVFHQWHGPRCNRDYEKRGRLIADFDPKIHLAPAPSGMWTWTAEADAVGLPARITAYFHRRQEDDTNHA
jgi:hypothetical protein